MVDQLISILAFCCLAMAAFGLGRPLVRGLGVGQEDRLSVAVWSIAVGLIAAGLLILGLGLLGVLYAPVIGLITMVACSWGLGEILRNQFRAARHGPLSPERTLPPQAADRQERGPEDIPWAPPMRWLSCGVMLAAGLAALGALVGALAPPTAGDALCYHLELPKTFLLEHRIVYLPYHDNATFPLLTEMWYLWGLAIDGGVCAQLAHWGLGILLALATVVLARPILGHRWAWIAGGLVILTPGVNNQMTAPMNDVALAAMTTLSLAAWWRAVVGQQDRRWFLLAGLAAGGALGTKYIALVFAAAVAVTWLWAMVRRPQQRRLLWQGAAVVGVVAISIGGIWYTRAAHYHGNPVFPLLSEVFRPDDTTAADPRGTLPASKSPLGRGPAGLVTAPWQITMHPGRFGGRGHQPGVLLLAAVPGLLFCRRLRGLGTLLAVASVYGVLWYLLRQNVRFLFPILPLLAVAVVWVWIEMRRFPSRPRWTAAATFAVILAAMAVVPLLRSRHQWAVATGWQTREAYLAEHEPTYRAAAVVRALTGDVLPKKEVHILSQDYRAFYFDCRVTRENTYRRSTRYDQRVTDPACFSDQLREAGFTHLLLAETIAPSGQYGRGIDYDPTLSRLADAQLASDNATGLLTLTNYTFRDCDGTTRRYRLVMLREQGF